MNRLLVIDDSPTIRKLVELTFRGSQWAVDFACSGGEGVERARQNLPDMILLDFVLPDMRGLDVCNRLSSDASTSGIPIVLMSAKDESIRHLFRSYPSVVDFVPKPFTPEELVARVRTASTDGEGRPRPSTRARQHAFSRTVTEGAARAIYGNLARGLSLVPSWCVQMGNHAAAPFLGRRLLSPEVVNDVLEALRPIFRELSREESGELLDPARGAADNEATLSGDLRGWPLEELCGLLVSGGRSGELRLTRTRDAGALVGAPLAGNHVRVDAGALALQPHALAVTLVYFREGEVVLVTSLDPSEHCRGDAHGLAGVSSESLASAAAEQRISGKPIFVTLSERGLLSSSFDLPTFLHRTGRRLLLESSDARQLHFAWRDLASLPSYVVEFGRNVRMNRETIPFDAVASSQTTSKPSLRQITLERLRKFSEGAADAGPAAATVLHRAVHFTDKLREVSLDATERRVLASIDGRFSVAEVAARCGLELGEVRRIAGYLHTLDVVTTNAGRTTRPVMVVEASSVSGAGDLEQLLQRVFARQTNAVPIVALGAEKDILDTALREQPRAIFMDTDGPSEIGEAARSLRARRELHDVVLVALVPPSANESRALEAAGFDVVFVKPIVQADLEQWIAPC